jgi:hypothetical protein
MKSCLTMLALLIAVCAQAQTRPTTASTTRPSYEDLLAENARLRHELSMLRAQLSKLTAKPASRPVRATAPAKNEPEPLSNPANITEALKVGMSKNEVANALKANGWTEMKLTGANQQYELYESTSYVLEDIRNSRYATIRVYLRFAGGKLSAFTK